MRQRYISFFIHPAEGRIHTSERDLIRELRAQCRRLFQKDWRDMGLWLIRFNGTQGIVRCNYSEKDRVIILLQSLEQIASTTVKVTTLKTSGTICGLIRHHTQRKQ